MKWKGNLWNQRKIFARHVSEKEMVSKILYFQPLSTII